MRYYSSIFILLLLILCGCSSEEPEIPQDEPSQEDSDYIYLEFNKWVYEQMNRSYLWRQDMPDSLSCDYQLAPKEFFESLLSPKDRFSYFTNNPYYRGRSEYGFAYQRYKTQGGQTVYQILYITNPQLREQGMRRGDFVEIETNTGYNTYRKLQISNNRFVKTDKTFKEGLASLGATNNTILLDSVYNVSGRNVGYICYLEFDQISDLEASLAKLYDTGIDELVVDLRYNPGGYVNTCRYLCNSVAPSAAYNNVFQKCSYNDILSREYMTSLGSPYTFTYYETPVSLDDNILGSKIIPLNLRRVIFLTSRYTASASEAAIICLRPYMDVVVIGETTTGKGVGSWTIYDTRYKYALQPITMRYYNAEGETTPDDGLVPDYYISDGYSVSKKEIGDSDELLLSAALRYISGESVIQHMAIRDLRSSLTVTPVGEPSFMTEFNNKHYNENN